MNEEEEKDINEGTGFWTKTSILQHFQLLALHNIATFRLATDSCQDVSLTEASCWVWLAPLGSSMTLEWHPASRIQMKVQRGHPWCEIPHVMQSMSEAIGHSRDPRDMLIVSY
ncbi:unnamed protein product [Leuciscus chuanchicus]